MAEPMTLSAEFLAELDHEMASTRKVLERVPEDRLAWRPHPKSRTMAELATHLASIPGYAPVTLSTDSVDLATVDESARQLPPAASRRELLDAFDRNVAAARAALAGAGDEALRQPWTMRNGERVLFTLPRIAVLRTHILHHAIHHRAQLGVYLRLNDVPVPGVYGPSADEAGA